MWEKQGGGGEERMIYKGWEKVEKCDYLLDKGKGEKRQGPNRRKKKVVGMEKSIYKWTK